MNRAFLETQIAAVEAQITAYNAAILAVGVGGMQSYTLDTGQTRQTVTKLDLSQLRLMKSSLLNELATLCARLNGAASLAVPAW